LLELLDADDDDAIEVDVDETKRDVDVMVEGIKVVEEIEEEDVELVVVQLDIVPLLVADG